MVVAPYVRNNNVYVAASIDKEKRLDTLSKPRLIFVGGSGMALGLNSKIVEEETGRKVVNMGVHAGLGLPFMLNESLDGLKPGDIVILCPEYSLDEGDKKLQSQLVDLNPKANKYLSFSLTDYIRFYVQNVQRCLSGSFYRLTGNDRQDPIYNRSAFNEEGDIISHYKLPGRKKLDDLVQWGILNNDLYIRKINDFIDHAKIKGAKVYFSYPAMCKSAFTLNYKVIIKLEKEYNKKLNCQIIGKPTSFVFNDYYFYDTVYHLREPGIKKRTNIIIQLLVPYL